MSAKPDLGTAIREALPTFEAPQSLHDWAREHARRGDRATSVPAKSLAQLLRGNLARTSLYAAGLLVAAVGGWAGGTSYYRHRQSVVNTDALVAELVDTHVRSLMGDHLMDIRSTDQHTVKPWFVGKIDFAPRVFDLSAKGFPLLGARTEYIHGRTNAVLVYGRRRHFINLFISPEATAEDTPGSRRYRGYSIIHWVTDGFSYWAVSDAGPRELEAFRQGYEAAM